MLFMLYRTGWGRHSHNTYHISSIGLGGGLHISELLGRTMRGYLHITDHGWEQEGKFTDHTSLLKPRKAGGGVFTYQSSLNPTKRGTSTYHISMSRIRRGIHILQYLGVCYNPLQYIKKTTRNKLSHE